MKHLLYILTFITLGSCSNSQEDSCKGKILDLEMKSFDDPNNKIMNYYKSNLFVEIKDTDQFLRYEDPNSITQFLEPSTVDPKKRRYIYKVKEEIIKTVNYQWDLLLRIDNDQKGENIVYWLKSYDNYRNPIGHLDFAGWFRDSKICFSGRIDCDSSLHMFLNNGMEHRIFKIDERGDNILVDTRYNGL